MNVPRVKAKDTMPIIPEIRKKGEVVAVVDTTTPMAGRDTRRKGWSGCVVGSRNHGIAIVTNLVGSIAQWYMLASCQDEVNNDLPP